MLAREERRFVVHGRLCISVLVEVLDLRKPLAAQAGGVVEAVLLARCLVRMLGDFLPSKAALHLDFFVRMMRVVLGDLTELSVFGLMLPAQHRIAPTAEDAAPCRVGRGRDPRVRRASPQMALQKLIGRARVIGLYGVAASIVLRFSINTDTHIDMETKACAP